MTGMEDDGGQHRKAAHRQYTELSMQDGGPTGSESTQGGHLRETVAKEVQRLATHKGIG